MPREGSVKRAAPSPSAAEPWPIRRVLAMTIASISAGRERDRDARVDAEPRRAPPRSRAAVMPPNDQPACSDDMIGLPRSRSTPTPWLFIETSIVALDAPNRNSPATTNSGCGASTIRLTASASAMPPIRVIRSEPCLTTIWPAIGKVEDHRQRHAEEDQAHGALGEVEALLDPRDLRDEGAEAGAVDEEDGRGRPAPAHARVTVTPIAR